MLKYILIHFDTFFEPYYALKNAGTFWFDLTGVAMGASKAFSSILLEICLPPWNLTAVSLAEGTGTTASKTGVPSYLTSAT